MANSVNFQNELSLQIKARFPAIYIITWEEQRLVATIKEMASNRSLFSKARDVWEWTVIDGFKCNGKSKGGDIQTSQRALEFINTYEGDGIFILKDLYHDLAQQARAIEASLIRTLKDLVWNIKEDKFLKTLIITGFDKFIPDDLQKEIQIRTFELPSKEELKEALLNLVKQNEHNDKLR
ncbi:MAG: hypothetical protein LBL58_18155, partial [Tannerellaceae bacterium]|nr:hypothetical protein [Tannerellaceae bacterium]